MAVWLCSTLWNDSWGPILQHLWWYWSWHYGNGIICYDFQNQFLIILKYCKCVLLSWLILRTQVALKLRLKLRFWVQGIRPWKWVIRHRAVLLVCAGCSPLVLQTVQGFHTWVFHMFCLASKWTNIINTQGCSITKCSIGYLSSQV